MSSLGRRNLICIISICPLACVFKTGNEVHKEFFVLQTLRAQWQCAKLNHFILLVQITGRTVILLWFWFDNVIFHWWFFSPLTHYTVWPVPRWHLSRHSWRQPSPVCRGVALGQKRQPTDRLPQGRLQIHACHIGSEDWWHAQEFRRSEGSVQEVFILILYPSSCPRV